MEKICPKCGKKFICNHDDILNCHCASVRLTPEQRKYIASEYKNCLCGNCLAYISNLDIS